MTAMIAHLAAQHRNGSQKDMTVPTDQSPFGHTENELKIRRERNIWKCTRRQKGEIAA